MKKIYDYEITNLVNNICFNDTNVTAYYKLPKKRFSFATNQSLINAALSFSTVLQGLISTTSMEAIECHLIVFSNPIKGQGYIDQILNSYEQMENPIPTPGKELVLEYGKMIEQARYLFKEVYLGVKLGERGDENGFGSFSDNIIGTIRKKIDKIILAKDAYVTEKEYEYWGKKEQIIYSNLSLDSFQIKRATPAQLATIIERGTNPNVEHKNSDTMTHWGPGALKTLMGAKITPHLDYLEHEYPNGQKNYTRVLCFTRFPKLLQFPLGTPWIYAVQTISPEAWFSSRFTICPTTKILKELRKNIKQTQDEARNAAMVKALPLDLQERLASAENLEYKIKEDDDTPWIYNNSQIIINAPNPQTLDQTCNEMVKIYRDIKLTAPIGYDQWPLFLQSFPGDKLRIPDFTCRQKLHYIPIGYPNGASSGADIEF